MTTSSPQPAGGAGPEVPARHAASTPIAVPTGEPGPIVRPACGPVRGVWRTITGATAEHAFARSAAFYGIPYAETPVGEGRFRAPVARKPWAAVRDAVVPGPTPQRKQLAEVTAIPEPVIPGTDTLNLNVFTPAPVLADGGQAGADAEPGSGSAVRGQAGLPVLVWIHGGGYQAGCASSPWYDGAAFNRDGVVTVCLSYRLGLDGFGWVAGSDAPSNRGLQDQVLALRWVRENIAAFGGDPSRVTVAGQSAGGGSVMCLLSSPSARGLFSQAISHSGAVGGMPVPLAQERARRAAELLGTTADLAGWCAVSEEDSRQVDDLLQEEIPMAGPDPVQAVRDLLVPGTVHSLPFEPVTGDEVLPTTVEEAMAAGVGAEVPLLAGATTHEFVFLGLMLAEAMSGRSAAQVLAEAGVGAEAIEAVAAQHPELVGDEPALLGIVLSHGMFHLPLLAWARSRGEQGAGGRTWLYQFDRRSPATGVAAHCSDLPFVFDCLAEPHAPVTLGEEAPQALATRMHSDWVRFIVEGDPGWAPWGGVSQRGSEPEEAPRGTVDNTPGGTDGGRAGNRPDVADGGRAGGRSGKPVGTGPDGGAGLDGGAGDTDDTVGVCGLGMLYGSAAGAPEGGVVRPLFEAEQRLLLN